MSLTLDDLAAGKYDLDDSAKAMIKTYTESLEQFSKAAKTCYDETRTKEMSLTLVQLATAIEQGKTDELQVDDAGTWCLGECILSEPLWSVISKLEAGLIRIKPKPRFWIIDSASGRFIAATSDAVVSDPHAILVKEVL